jgi:hypothetical protein
MSFLDRVEIPEELKSQVVARLKGTGTLRRLTREVKVAMTAAIAEIKGLRSDSKNSETKSVVEHEGLTNIDAREKAGLQAIYKFFRAHGLEYTLETLAEESAVPEDAAGVDLEALFVRNRLNFITDPPH